MKKLVFLISEVLRVYRLLTWKTNFFYKRLCEVRNGAIGEKNAFAVKDKSYLVAAKFSGGTWDVERQKIGRAKDIAIDLEWSYVSCYEELDRFLKGYATSIEMKTLI